jgi:hypothetical protein
MGPILTTFPTSSTFAVGFNQSWILVNRGSEFVSQKSSLPEQTPHRADGSVWIE